MEREGKGKKWRGGENIESCMTLFCILFAAKIDPLSHKKAKSSIAYAAAGK
jgi:hypothetical protein